MSGRELTFMIVVFMLVIAALSWPRDVQGSCMKSFCDKTERTPIVNTRRQRVGDIYNPGTGRVQIRDNSRRIVGYIEPTGKVTDTSRRAVGRIKR